MLEFLGIIRAGLSHQRFVFGLAIGALLVGCQPTKIVTVTTQSASAQPGGVKSALNPAIATAAAAGTYQLGFQTPCLDDQQQIVRPNLYCSTFPQISDHDAPASPTFAQRLMVDTTYSKGSAAAPVLFYLQGESPIAVNDMDELLDLAAGTGATIVHLENRFYGQSLPATDLSAASMATNTIGQALADFVTFIQTMKTTQHMTGPWVTLGGSYSGMQSAAMRALHPDLIAGAIASSAPVLFTTDFPAYGQVVANDLGAPCATALRGINSYLEQTNATSPAAFATLMAQLNQPAGSLPADVEGQIAYYVAGFAQYGTPGMQAFCQSIEGVSAASGLGIALQAAATANASSTATGTAVATASKQMRLGRSLLGRSRLNRGVTRNVTTVANGDQSGTTSGAATIPQPGTPAAAAWSWEYTTCTEFGGFQSSDTNPATTVYGPAMTMANVMSYCSQFTSDGSLLQPNVPQTVQSYQLPITASTTTRIMFTHGTADPWSPLTVQTAPSDAASRDISIVTINGGTHCADIDSIDPSTSPLPDVLTARAQMVANLKRWYGLTN